MFGIGESETYALVGLAIGVVIGVVVGRMLAGRGNPAEPPPPPPPPKPSGAPLRLLALLQREGRLVDFLLEDLTHASPDNIVAGVREIHPKCQHALKEHLVLEPVLPGPENEMVQVPPGFDPSAVTL